jgi:subtilisin family serine protease
MIKYLLASFFTVFSLNLFMFTSLETTLASTVAIIDSGVDYQHVKLAPYMWTNPLEQKDNKIDDDANAYIDDYFGWNFAGNNSQVINYKYLGTFSPDVYTFFEYQLKMVLGTISEEEIAWIKEKSQDEKLIGQLDIFGNFIHGTHVAGISINQTTENKVMALKIIPTGDEASSTSDSDSSDSEMDEINKDLAYAESKGLKGKEIVKFLLSQLSKRHMEKLTEVSKYINSYKVDVANGSFGTSIINAVDIVSQIYPAILNSKPSPEDVVELAFYYLNENLRFGKLFVGAAPKTLFVFAAGNDEDGTGIGNNDKFPNSPCNIAADNVISVAATVEGQSLAPFSDWGKEKVDVAAPGVGILSTIPSENHDEMFAISGTSQAAPYVANVAAEVKNANTKLSPKEIKRLIVETVDAKDFLKDKVRSGGMVNKNRALLAAKLTNTKSLDESIAEAKTRIANVTYQRVKGLGLQNLNLLYVRPLANPFPFSLK